MAAPALSIRTQNAALLSDPALREGLLNYARRRLPAAEVEDLVQNALTEALTAPTPPSDPAEFRRWVHGIARHKIADTFRRRDRLPIPTADIDHNAAQPIPSIAELGQWVERELPKTETAHATLHWLLREGDGETLDEIARDVNVPAPRVRQRVSRLRRHFHARWMALSAAGLLSLLVAGTLIHRAKSPDADSAGISRESFGPLERARVLRQKGLERCAAGAYEECIAALDEAKGLDPSGEQARAISEARAAAASLGQASPARPTGSLSAPPSSSGLHENWPQKSAPPSKFAPKPSIPKRLAPSKPNPKSAPVGAQQKSNALPSKTIAPNFDSNAGSELRGSKKN